MIPTQLWIVRRNSDGKFYTGQYGHFSDTSLPKLYRRRSDASNAITHRLTNYRGEDGRRWHQLSDEEQRDVKQARYSILQFDVTPSTGL